MYLASAITVLALMLFLVIYNIFVINSMQNGIEMLQGDVLQQEQRYSEVYGRYKNLTQTDNIISELENNGYIKMDESNLYYVTLENVQTVTPLKGDTNWFDAICNFISNLFVN